MNSQTRRSLAAAVCGVAAALVALYAAAWLSQDACLDAGGRWLAAARACALPAGAAPPGAPVRAYALGALAGVATAVVLWRTYTFFVARGGRR
jgi:hypothetical protein